MGSRDAYDPNEIPLDDPIPPRKRTKRRPRPDPAYDPNEIPLDDPSPPRKRAKRARRPNPTFDPNEIPLDDPSPPRKRAKRARPADPTYDPNEIPLDDPRPPRKRAKRARPADPTYDPNEIPLDEPRPPRKRAKRARPADPTYDPNEIPLDDPRPPRKRAKRARPADPDAITSSDMRSMRRRLQGLREDLPPRLQSMVDRDDGGRTRSGQRVRLRSMGLRSLGEGSAHGGSSRPSVHRSVAMDVDSGDDLPARRRPAKTSAQRRRYWERLDPPRSSRPAKPEAMDVDSVAPRVGSRAEPAEPAPRRAFKKNGRHPTARTGARPRRAPRRGSVEFLPGLDVRPKKYEWSAPKGGAAAGKGAAPEQGGLYARLAYGKDRKIRDGDPGDVEARLARIARDMRGRA